MKLIYYLFFVYIMVTGNEINAQSNINKTTLYSQNDFLTIIAEIAGSKYHVYIPKDSTYSELSFNLKKSQNLIEVHKLILNY